MAVNFTATVSIKLLEDEHELLLGLISLENSLHHKTNELIKVDLAVIIIVDFSDQLIDLFFVKSLAQTLHDFADFFVVYSSIARLVEYVKYFLVFLDFWLI